MKRCLNIGACLTGVCRARPCHACAHPMIGKCVCPPAPSWPLLLFTLDSALSCVSACRAAHDLSSPNSSGKYAGVSKAGVKCHPFLLLFLFSFILYPPLPRLKATIVLVGRGTPKPSPLRGGRACVCGNVLSYCPRSFPEEFPQTNWSPNKFIRTYMLTSQISAVKMSAVGDIFSIKVEKGGNNEASHSAGNFWKNESLDVHHLQYCTVM